MKACSDTFPPVSSSRLRSIQLRLALATLDLNLLNELTALTMPLSAATEPEELVRLVRLLQRVLSTCPR